MQAQPDAIHAALDALGGELARVQARRQHFHRFRNRELLALDTSVIAAYAGLGTTEDHESIRLVQALLSASDLSFTLLPPTRLEIQRLYSGLASQLLPRESPPREDESHSADELARSQTSLGRATWSIQRLDELWRAQNIVASPSLRDERELPPTVAVVSSGLLKHSLGHRARALIFNDATCIALAFLLTQEGLPVSWVTAGQLEIRWALDAIGAGEFTLGHCVLDPGCAAVSVGFRNAGVSSIEELRQAVREVAAALTIATSPRIARPFPATLSHLLEQVESWANAKEASETASARWAESWNRLPPMPQPHALEALAARLDEAKARARDQLVRSFCRLGAALELDEFSLLGAAARGAKLTFEKLIVYSEHTMTNIYNINQAGNNLSVVIDSFNSVSQDFAAGNNEVVALLQDFLQQVQTSDLEQQDKKDVIQIAASTIADVKEKGKLSGAARIAWRGVKEVLATVPGLVSLWDRISDLFV